MGSIGESICSNGLEVKCFLGHVACVSESKVKETEFDGSRLGPGFEATGNVESTQDFKTGE